MNAPQLPDERPDPLNQPKPDELQAVRATARSGMLGMLVVWLAIGSVLWGVFTHFEAGRREKLKPTIGAGGEIVIPRSPDGHFYIDGTVAGVPIRFMVDTGASGVAVTDSAMRGVDLGRGEAITTNTANGPRPSVAYRAVRVTAGSAEVPAAVVIVGLSESFGGAGSKEQEGLLGQSFLQHFDVRMREGRMELRALARSD